MRELQRSLGFRALLVTHDPADLVPTDQVFVYEGGRVFSRPVSETT
jgi:hypothetical protein